MSKTFWDTEELVSAAFEADWKHTKLGKAGQRVIKEEDELAKVRKLLLDTHFAKATLAISRCNVPFGCR
jgi:hypothetical protein